MSYEAFHHSSNPFHYSIPSFHSTECRHPIALTELQPYHSTCGYMHHHSHFYEITPSVFSKMSPSAQRQNQHLIGRVGPKLYMHWHLG